MSSNSVKEMSSADLQQLVVDVLKDLKAIDVRPLDVRGMTSITDVMVIASGTSSRHVKSIADNLMVEVKKAGAEVLGHEGADLGEWVLVDLIDVVVHVMLPDVRDFYNLEKLWDMQDIDSKDKNSEKKQ